MNYKKILTLGLLTFLIWFIIADLTYFMFHIL